MRKILNILLCSFVLFLAIVALININTNLEIEIKNERILVADNNIFNAVKKANENIEKYEKEKLERIEKEKKEQKKTTKVVTTSSNNSVNVNNKPTSTPKNSSIKYGTFGRLYVSNYNVALYDYNVNTNSNSDLQTIVNNKDSAAYYMTNGKLVIADHSYQGFSILADLGIGTTSTIKFKDGSTIKYKLIKKARGVNTGPDLIDTNGNSFFKMKSDIIMYTCYKDGIMATLWVLS